MDVVIGLDCGTSATKAVAAALDGSRVVVCATASEAYPLLVPAPGRAELDPALLQAAVVRALAAVAADVQARGDHVVAVCLSAAMHGTLPMGEDGSPLGPLVTWADERAATEAASLVADGRARDLHRRTGTPVHAMSPLAKLAWWSRHDPDLVRRTPRWGGVKELIVAALCDVGHVVDLSCASTTGLYDIHAGRWDEEAMEFAGVRVGQLAEVLPTTELLTGLRPDVAAATGLPPGVPIVIGAADGVLANLGVGAVVPGAAAVSLGTSGALRTVVPAPAVDPDAGLFCYALTQDHWVVGGPVNNAGSVVRWASRAFDAPHDGPAPESEPADLRDAALLAEAGEAPVGSQGLLCLPYLLGERAPWWRPGLSGAYVGLRREHGRGHLVRAAVEGVCQQLALVRDALDATGLDVTEVRATGGAVVSPLWVSTLAATLDLPVRVAGSPEGTGLGACLLGFFALEHLPDLETAASLVELHDTVEPDRVAAEHYRRMRPLVERSMLALVEVFAELDTTNAASP